MRRLWISAGALAVALSSLVQAMPASAYIATQACSTGTVSQATAAAGQPITFTATFKGGTNCGQVDAAQVVTFSQQSGPTGCTATLSPTTATTDANGQASTTITLPPNCPGTFVFAAGEGGVTVTVTVRESGGFPASTTDPSTPAPSWPIWLILAGVVAALAGSGTLALRKLRA
jgi:hypothetical protein